MTIAWTYLDKRGAAVDALKDFASMEYIIANHADNEETLREDMTAAGTSNLGSVPGSNNPHAGEARLNAKLDEIDVLKERYRQALEYMDWFRPAWEELSADEQFILTEFFLRQDITKTEAILNIGERLHVERAQAYRYKDKALNRLALLLYGK